MEVNKSPTVHLEEIWVEFLLIETHISIQKCPKSGAIKLLYRKLYIRSLLNFYTLY